MTTKIETALTSEQLASALSEDYDFRVLRRLDFEAMHATNVPDNAGVAIVLDVETTGKNPDDRIIELGMVAFAYNRDSGEIYGTIDSYSGLEDPGMPIDPAAAAVNGITAEMVDGQVLDEQKVEGMLMCADFVLAHNAQFDRHYCEKRFPCFEAAAWACSLRQVAWAASGITSSKLDYIAYKQGFFFEAHRAGLDALALLHAVRLPLMGGPSAFSQILAKYRDTSRRVWALNAPFDAKDLLKARGYRWSDGLAPNSEKAWVIEVPETEYETELAFLKESVYRGKPLALPVDTIDACTRFSTRRGIVERVYR